MDIIGVNLKMHVKKRYDENSDIAEIEIHDINTKDIYKPSPKILDIHQPTQKTIKSRTFRHPHTFADT